MRWFTGSKTVFSRAEDTVFCCRRQKGLQKETDVQTSEMRFHLLLNCWLLNVESSSLCLHSTFNSQQFNSKLKWEKSATSNFILYIYIYIYNITYFRYLANWFWVTVYCWTVERWIFITLSAFNSQHSTVSWIEKVEWLKKLYVWNCVGDLY